MEYKLGTGERGLRLWLGWLLCGGLVMALVALATAWWFGPT